LPAANTDALVSADLPNKDNILSDILGKHQSNEPRIIYITTDRRIKFEHHAMPIGCLI
jgi:hypothetical protein